MIRLNKRRGNEYAVIRDEVLVKSYTLLRMQNKMVVSIFEALDYYDIKKFEIVMHELFAKSQIEIHTLENIDYKPILALKETSKTLEQAQKNIKDFYALLEINGDVLRHFVDAQERVYRLNKYAKYNLLSSVLYINHMPIVQKLNSSLKAYGLDVVKLLLILLISILIYFIRKVLYGVIEVLFLKTRYLKKYAQEILNDIRRPITILLLLLNIELAIYIYNDFNSFDIVNKVFNMIYAFFFTMVLYKTLNSMATIKIHSMEQSEKKVKDEMINVGIKIINFLIMIFGLLLILHFAGANLTTVLSGLGIGGFAVALAARESLANFFGTLSILMSDVFSQGDWIVADGKEGTVVEIGLRVTTIRTFDNALIAIPNAILANNDVKNWSKRTIGRKMKMTLRFKYGSKVENINNAVEEIREMLKHHPDIATEETSYEDRLDISAKLVSKEDSLGVKRTLRVYLNDFSESSINVLVHCFTKTTNWNDWLEIKEDVMYKIMEIVEKNSLEFAFPSMSLYQEKKEDDS